MDMRFLFVLSGLLPTLLPVFAARPLESVAADSRSNASPSMDPRVATAIEGLEVREQRLAQILVTYEFHNVWTDDGSAHGPVAGPRQARAEELPERLQRSRITWARKGRKMLYDQSFLEMTGRVPYRRFKVYDGEKLLTMRYEPTDRKDPTSQAISHGGHQLNTLALGAVLVGLRMINSKPLSEQLKSAARVRCLGYEQINRERCLVLEVQPAEPGPDRMRLWLDTAHGLLLRRARDYSDGQLAREVSASDVREVSPGLFLAFRVVTRIFWHHGQGKPGSVRATQTATVQKATVESLPDQLFNTTPKQGAQPFDTRTGRGERRRPNIADSDHGLRRCVG